ncbi:MAG: DUF4139 domain-containing protein [Gammaproteobacteria bacterium]|nr:DUF4139 domain-containing protein [Gammaproteobacteria bacterium]
MMLISLAISAAGGTETAVTLYSSQQPGAIPAEYYRPLPGEVVPAASAIPGFALVRLDRDVRIEAGRSTLRFLDVAALIDPTTVTFSVPGDPATRVLEQNFQFDLVSTARLLQRYVDRPVTVERGSGDQRAQLGGTLLSAGDGIVLRGADGSITALRDYTALRFADLPGGLITQPTLVWDLNAASGGMKRARVTYQTGGMTWWADYNVIFEDAAGHGSLELAAWVSVINQSGASFENAQLKLVAGDVNRVQPGRVAPAVLMKTMRAAEAAEGFAERAFDEFHLYTLGRRTTLPNNSTKQIELFERTRRIPARRLLTYDAFAAPALGGPYTERDPGMAPGTRVAAWLEFRNDSKSGLGVPLPAGRVRVARVDTADGSLEFIGEDVIGHTPRDETVRLRLGSAFDVVGERRQSDFALDSRARWMEEAIEVRIRNHKAQPVQVQVREPLYRWSGWKILSSSHPYVKDSAQQVHFDVDVGPDAEAVVRYRVRYGW